MNESIRKIIDTKFKKSLLVGTLAVSLVGSSLLSQNVDAKKNSKPKIVMKGKLKKKKLTLTKGQVLKLKFKAKDKEDGNLTKKVKVKVQKPKSGKIKKSKRKIKFLKIGKYKLTFTVKDSKNKKTKVKRIVKVVPKTINNDNNSDNNLILNTSSPSDLPENTTPYVSTKPDVSKNVPTEVPINTNTPINTSISTSEPTLAPESSVNPVTTQTPILPTINPINTTIPTSTPVQTQVPTSTPVQTQVPTSTPVQTQVPTSTPVQTQAPTSTPVNTVEPVVTSTPSATYDPFYDALHQKYDVELKTINNKNYYITKEKITEEKFMDNSSENSLTIKFANDYENIVFDKTSKYLRTDEYMKFIGSISAKDYKGRSATSNIIISTNSLYTEEGKLENKTDKKYPIYVYVEDYEGNACTKVFYVSAHEYTEEEKNKYHNAMYGEFNYLIQNNPIVFGYKKSLIDMMDEFSDIKEKVLK